MTETKTITQREQQLVEVKKDFPILKREVNGHPLIYLDNAATTQKPQGVINALTEYYSSYNSNIHRGVHTLANEATEAFEKTRNTAAGFINSKVDELVLTKGTTESINLVARTWGEKSISKDDVILVGGAEHHSNIVPWQLLSDRVGCKVRPVKIKEEGVLDLEDLRFQLSENVKLVAVNLISNSLGTINPVKEVGRLAKEFGAKVLIDGAQAAPHMKIDVQDLDCHFLAFSGHKMYGPTGVGFLFGKSEILNSIPPFQGGGEMIKEVSFEGTSYLDPPLKFEAGTPNIADVIAMQPAFELIQKVGFEKISEMEKELIRYSRERMASIPGLKEFGTSQSKTALFSFIVDGVHSFDLGQLLDAKGIAVRTGHHCTMPLMDSLGIEGTVRASFGIYNTVKDAEYLWDQVERIQSKYGSA